MIWGNWPAHGVAVRWRQAGRGSSTGLGEHLPLPAAAPPSPHLFCSLPLPNALSTPFPPETHSTQSHEKGKSTTWPSISHTRGRNFGEDSAVDRGFSYSLNNAIRPSSSQMQKKSYLNKSLLCFWAHFGGSQNICYKWSKFSVLISSLLDRSWYESIRNKIQKSKFRSWFQN